LSAIGGGSALFGIRTRALAAAAAEIEDAAIQSAIATIVTIFDVDVFDVDIFDNDFSRTPVAIRIIRVDQKLWRAAVAGKPYEFGQRFQHFGDSLFFRSSIKETQALWTVT
jgi:hypothetical protein